MAFWLWVLRRKIYGASLDRKMYIPSCSYCQRCHWQTHLQTTRPSRLNRLGFTFFDPAPGCSEGGTQHFLGLWRHSVSGQLATFPTSMAAFPDWLSSFASIWNSKCSPCWRIFRPEIGFFHFLGRNSKTGRRWSASFGCGWRFAKCLDANGQMVYKFKRQVLQRNHNDFWGRVKRIAQQMVEGKVSLGQEWWWCTCFFWFRHCQNWHSSSF